MIGASTVHADPDDSCSRVVALTGEPALVVPISRRLARSGVTLVARKGCRPLRVAVKRHGDRLRCTIRDAHGRTSVREVNDVATAAAIIDSWTRMELASHPPAPEEAPLPSTAGEPDTSLAVVEVSTAARSRLGVGASLEAATAGNGSTWVGTVLRGGVDFGGVWLGALLRVAADTHWSGDTDGAERSHSGGDLLVTVDLPQALGGFSVSPGAGAGIGWMHLGSGHLPGVLTKPAEDHSALVLDVHVVLSRKLTRGLALELGVALDTLALHSQDSDEGGEGCSILPREFFRASLGLRYNP